MWQRSCDKALKVLVGKITENTVCVGFRNLKSDRQLHVYVHKRCLSNMYALPMRLVLLKKHFNFSMLMDFWTDYVKNIQTRFHYNHCQVCNACVRGGFDNHTREVGSILKKTIYVVFFEIINKHDDHYGPISLTCVTELR